MTYNTDRKKEITELLSSECEHSFSSEEICNRVLTDGKGKSTVYRIISELVGEGIIKRIADKKSRRVTYQYLGEKKCSEHLHLKCKSCEKLIHLDKATSALIISSLKCGSSFSLDPTEILSGICQGCAGKEK